MARYTIIIISAALVFTGCTTHKPNLEVLPIGDSRKFFLLKYASCAMLYNKKRNYAPNRGSDEKVRKSMN